MRIFFTASFYGKSKLQNYYNLVLAAIQKTGVDIISPELSNYKTLLTVEEMRKISDPKLIHYEAIKRGIFLSDAVVIEISHEDFQLGHEATLSMLNKKPVLCLSLYEDFSRKIRNKYMHGAQYSEFTIDSIVRKFIERTRKFQLSERFNMFLSPAQVEFLQVQSEKERVPMSEYIRRLIDKERIEG